MVDSSVEIGIIYTGDIEYWSCKEILKLHNEAKLLIGSWNITKEIEEYISMYILEWAERQKNEAVKWKVILQDPKIFRLNIYYLEIIKYLPKRNNEDYILFIFNKT